jgi:hypothetical protein
MFRGLGRAGARVRQRTLAARVGVAVVLAILLTVTVAQSMAGEPTVPPIAASTSAPADAPRTIGVPGAIDATGARDVSDALNAFLDGVPDGSTVAFPRGATYRLGSAIRIQDRHDLDLEGNGATLRVAGCDVEDSAFLIDGPASARLSIRQFTIVGDNEDGGTTKAFTGGCESAMGVAIYGARDVAMSELTISSVHGDCVYIDAGGNPRGTTPWSERITFRDSTCRRNGRMGVAIIAAHDVTVTRTTFDDIAISVFDIEPTRPDGGATSISLTDNLITDYGASSQYTPWVLEGSAYDMTTTVVHDVTLARNRITGMTRSEHTGASGGLRVKAMTEGWARFSIIDNVSTVAGDGPTMYFQHLDGLRVEGNVQPLTKGPLVWFDDTTG